MNTDPHKIKRPKEKSPFGRNGAKQGEDKPLFTKGQIAKAFAIVAIAIGSVISLTNDVNQNDSTDTAPEARVTALQQTKNNQASPVIDKSEKETVYEDNGGPSTIASYDCCPANPDSEVHRKTQDETEQSYQRAFIKKIGGGVAVVSADQRIGGRDLLISDPNNKISEKWQLIAMPKQYDGSYHPDLDVKNIAKVKSKEVGGSVIGRYQNNKNHTSTYKIKPRTL